MSAFLDDRAINIKNAETVRLARRLARLEGRSITQSLTEALRERSPGWRSRRPTRPRAPRWRVSRPWKGPTAVVALEALYRELGLEVVAMTAEAGRIAADAYLRYGKGVGDPAVLNYGDCLVYGVAMERGEKLLFKGDDFAPTDVPLAAWKPIATPHSSECTVRPR